MSAPSPGPCFGPSLSAQTPSLVPSHHSQSFFHLIFPLERFPLVPCFGSSLCPITPFPHPSHHSLSPFPRFRPSPSVFSLSSLFWDFPQSQNSLSLHISHRGQSPFPHLSLSISIFYLSPLNPRPDPLSPSIPDCSSSHNYSRTNSLLIWAHSG